MFLLLKMRQVCVFGNLEEPGPDGTLAAVLATVFQGFEESLLGDLIGGIRASAHGKDKEIDVSKI